MKQALITAFNRGADLADQLLLPLALASGVSTFTALRPTGHLMTNAWTIGQFGIANISIEQGAP